MRAERAAPLIIAEARGRYAARPPIVVDCSVVAAVLFDEPNREEAAQALGGKDLLAPELLADELVSVAMRKSRQGLDDLARHALADFVDLDLTRCRCDVQGLWRLALEHDLSAYDAAYLWLAAAIAAPLATFDKRLGTAARALLSKSWQAIQRISPS
jgi:predicted nucleic acid-binding protein